jgi:hypothetical protein
VTETSRPPVFAPGEKVKVRYAQPSGHVRTPAYVRGHRGVVERVCGNYANPEELAYARSGLPAKPLYRVRFSQADLWPDYQGESSDSVDVEIFEHWLDRE